MSTAQLPNCEEPQNPRPEASLSQSETDYTLGSDRVRIDIFEVSPYSGEYQILLGSLLILLLISSVSVQGLTRQASW